MYVFHTNGAKNMNYAYLSMIIVLITYGVVVPKQSERHVRHGADVDALRWTTKSRTATPSTSALLT